MNFSVHTGCFTSYWIVHLKIWEIFGTHNKSNKRFKIHKKCTTEKFTSIKNTNPMHISVYLGKKYENNLI